MISRLPDPSLLRGRDAEIATLERHLKLARSGTSTVVIIEGGAGLGKTALLRDAVARAAGQEFRTGLGTADNDGMVDLAPVLEALFDGEPPLLDRAALPAPHASPEQRFWVLRDIQSLLEQAAGQHPLLICLDDLQWADSGTGVALQSLPARLPDLPLMWMLTARPGQRSARIRTALRELVAAGAEHLLLQPLDGAAVEQIVADTLGARPDENLRRAAARLQGSPFLVVEFARGLKQEGLVAVESDQARMIGRRPPSRVSDDMRRRLSNVSKPAEHVATCASSLSRRFSAADLGALAGLPAAELVSPVRELIQADILSESGERLAFTHDLIRGAVRASVPATVRRALDRQGAEVLLARGALPVEVARQLAASADPGDEVAIATLLKAADALGTTDPAASADLAAQALLLTDAQHPLRGPLVSCRAISLFAAGLGEEAKRFADTELRHTLPPAQEADVRLSIATMSTLSPDLRADNARRALALPGIAADRRALLAGMLLHNLVVAQRTGEAQREVAGLRQIAAEGQSREGQFAFALAETCLAIQLLQFDSAARHLESAAQIGTGRDVHQRRLEYFRSWMFLTVDRFADASQILDDSIRDAQRDRQNWALRMFETTKGLTEIQSGRLPAAAALLEGKFTASGAHLIDGVIDSVALSGLGQVRIHTGDERGAREVADMCQIVLETSAPGPRRHAAWYLASYAMAGGRSAEAHQRLLTLGHAERLSIFPLFPHDVANDPELLRIALAVGDDELVAHVVEIAERRQRLNPGHRSALAIAAHVRGLASRRADDLKTAVGLLRSVGRPLARASALEDLGQLQVMNGDTAGGIEALSEALRINTGIGALWDAARVRSRLRRLGVRRRIVQPQESPRTGWDALTAAEVQVARLAAEGKTNPEIAGQLFVSRFTVAAHLRRVFEKTGIRSRVELAKALAERAD